MIVAAFPVCAQELVLTWSSFGSGSAVGSSEGDLLYGMAGQVIVGLGSDGVNSSASGFYANPDVQSSILTSAGDQPPEIPTEYGLSQNYPNPFNPSTKIEFALPVAGHVRLTIFNTLGQLVATVIDDEMAAGYQVALWNGRNDHGEDVGSGVYFYRIVAASGNNPSSFVQVKKMVLLH